jgi:hypothetical protein
MIEICGKHACVKNVKKKNGSMDWMPRIQLKTKVKTLKDAMANLCQ